ILIGQCRSRGVSEVHTVLIKKENRAQRSWSVSLNQESDTRQDILERRADEDHLERVEHRLGGESVRVDGRRYCLIRESRCRSGVCHKKTGRLSSTQSVSHESNGCWSEAEERNRPQSHDQRGGFKIDLPVC